MLRPLLVAINLLLVSFVAEADIHVWRDAKGGGTTALQEIEALVGRPLRQEFHAVFNAPFRSGAGTGWSDDGVWWVTQQAGANRVTVVPNGDAEPSALRVHTEPGDFPVPGNGGNVAGAYLAGVGGDLTKQSGASATNGFEGVTSVWEWSILFPDDFVVPDMGSWSAIFEFHNIGDGLANFLLASRVPEVPSGEMAVRVSGGSSRTNTWYGIGPLVRNVWYRFALHIKWSSGSDGFAKLWLKQGSAPYVLKVDHTGPTKYPNENVYLMLNNYHPPHAASSVIHSRVIRHGVQ